MMNLKDAIKIELTEKKPCLKKADVAIPAEAVDNEIELAVAEFAKFAKLPGFREGKAPKNLIKKRFAANIKEELTRRFQVAAFEKIREINDTDIVTLPIPEGNIPEPESGQEFAFAMTMNVAPEFKLPKYTGIKLKKNAVKVDKKEVEGEIDRFREMYSEFTKIEEAAKEGDMLKISYTSDLDAPEDATAAYKRYVSAEDSWCWLSEPEMLPGIIKTLKGAKAGSEKKLNAEFPVDFTEPLLVGKKAKYEIKVTEVQRRMPLKSDEEFCKRINVSDIKTFREQIEENLESRAQMTAEGELRQAAMDAVCGEVKKIDLPPDMLAQTVQMEMRNIANQLVKSEEDVESFKKDQGKHQKDAEAVAQKSLTNYFVCKKIADEEEITVEQADIDNRIAGMSRAYGYKEEDLRKQLQSSGGIEQLHMDILVAKVNDLIIEKADIAEAATKKSAKKADDKKEDKKETKKEDKK